MPPGPTAPRSLAGLLVEFRPCFTAPTFLTFIGLVVGLIAQTRRAEASEQLQLFASGIGVTPSAEGRADEGDELLEGRRWRVEVPS